MTEFTITNESCRVESLVIEHSLSSSVELVGLQVWRGALLLADYLLANPNLVTDRHVLELAAGTGLTSITAGMMAKTVVSTDVDRGDILKLIERNKERNQEALADCNFSVTELDFFWESLPAELSQQARESELILAADVVYDKDITMHFFKTLRTLLSLGPKTALIAIEKRLHAGEDGEIVAPNYKIFLESLTDLHGSELSKDIRVEVTHLEVDFPQCLQYTRVPELNLFKVESIINST